ncbi:MAG TPA: hypothetical protein PKK60_00095 [archaeon]|nr:hypothetical protein [archaeon]
METKKKKKERMAAMQKNLEEIRASNEARWERDKLCSTDRNIMDASKRAKKK